MRKFIVLLATLLIILSTACGNEVERVEDNKEKVLYASFYPLEYMADRIIEDKMEVRNLLSNSQGIHGWEPSAKEMSDLEDAGNILINGAGLEPWLEKVSGTIKNLEVYDTSINVDLIEVSENHDSHSSDEEGHGNYDPHFWLSPKSALVQAENVYKYIIQMDPDNKGIYEENYKGLKEDLIRIDQEYREGLEGRQGRSIIVPHDAFGYIEKDYGLKQIPINTIYDDGEVDLSSMSNLIEQAKEMGIKDVLYEDETSTDIADTIVSNTGGQALPIYTIEKITDKNLENHDDYISLLRKNLESFVIATQS